MFIKQKQDSVERGQLKNKEELKTGQPKYQFNAKIGKDKKISQNIYKKDTEMENERIKRNQFLRRYNVLLKKYLGRVGGMEQ